MTSLVYGDYRKKIKGCFLGKAVGGTLGAPFEGRQTTHNITFYDPVPTEMLPNDDLDLQVVWLECVRENGLPVNRRHLAEAWLRHVHFAYDEYGLTLRNNSMGLYPPLSGYFNNEFYAGMGAAIRSEIWACMAPANPELAVALAREDSCCDHYDDGVFAAEFFAAIESAAFVESDAIKLINIGLSFLPENTRFTNAIRDTIRWWNELGDMFAVRELILKNYYAVNWTDVTINCSFVVLAWLAGKGDFSDSICCATNLGHDTDCTAGTLASILGIINPDGIDSRWSDPIGQDLVLSTQIIGMHELISIDVMCDKIAEICLDVQDFYNTNVEICDAPEQRKYPYAKPWKANACGVMLDGDYCKRESLVTAEPIMIKLTYPQGGSLVPQCPEEFTAQITNVAAAEGEYTLNMYVPDSWKISPAEFKVDLKRGETATVNFSVTAPADDTLITVRNYMQFVFSSESASYRAKAGMVISLPWKRIKLDGFTKPQDADFKNAETIYSNYSVQEVPKGIYAYAIDFKVYTTIEVNLVPMGTPIKFYLDGELKKEHEGMYMTPSVHRYEDSYQEELKAGWHRAVIVCDNTGDTYNRMFFCVGNMPCRIWMDQIEWRKSNFAEKK